MSHFWEVPAFRETEASGNQNWLYGTPSTPEESVKFSHDVINKILHGDLDDPIGNNMPSLLPYTRPGGPFHMAQKPVWTNVTPRARRGGPADHLYKPEVEQIRRVLQDLFPGVPNFVVNYISRDDPHSQANTPSGKVLFQYDPFEALIYNPENPCEVFQMAKCKLWVEGRLVYQNVWAAEEVQRIPGLIDSLSYETKHKRDKEHPACRIPSMKSLPQASIEHTGPDLSFNAPPGPDTTLWITLGGAARAGPSSIGPRRSSSFIPAPRRPTRSSTPAVRATVTAPGKPPTTPRRPIATASSKHGKPPTSTTPAPAPAPLHSSSQSRRPSFASDSLY